MKIENDSSLTSRYYSNVLKQATQYGIDCKVYGAICAISEIKNAVPLVHGPEGCAYYAKWLYPELFEDMDPNAIHQEYLDRFIGIDLDRDEHGVFVFPLLKG